MDPCFCGHRAEAHHSTGTNKRCEGAFTCTCAGYRPNPLCSCGCRLGSHVGPSQRFPGQCLAYECSPSIARVMTNKRWFGRARCLCFQPADIPTDEDGLVLWLLAEHVSEHSGIGPGYPIFQPWWVDKVYEPWSAHVVCRVCLARLADVSHIGKEGRALRRSSTPIAHIREYKRDVAELADFHFRNCILEWWAKKGLDTRSVET